VAMNEEFKALAHEIALQIAATDPLYVSSEAIPPEVVEKEKMIAKEEFASSGKPADVVEKIIEGKIKKWQSEICLLAQPSIKDEDKTVQDMITAVSAKMGEKVEVKRFCRYAIGA
jgi:elongation factor Ts